MSPDLQIRLTQDTPRLQQIRRLWLSSLQQAGFEDCTNWFAQDPQAYLSTDPYDGSQTLVVEWRLPSGNQARALLHGNSSVFAELQIFLRHPRLPGQFLESINVWGKGEQLVVEPSLLSLPPE